MRLRRVFLWSAGLAALAVVYYMLAAFSIAKLWMPQPDGWILPFSRLVTALSWMHLNHGLALLMAALPIALLLRWLPVRRPVALAFGVAFVGLALPNLWLGLQQVTLLSPTMRVSQVLDLLKFALLLPVLTWLITRAWCNPAMRHDG